MADAGLDGRPRSALTVELYIKTPKGYFPQDDTGLIFGSTRGLARHLLRGDGRPAAGASTIVLRRSGGAGVGSSVGGIGFERLGQSGPLFISLKPLAERGGLATDARDRPAAPEARAASRASQLFMFPAQDVRVGGRAGGSQYQFTLWSSDLDELLRLGAEGGRPLKHGAGPRRRLHRSRAGRAAAQCRRSTATRPPALGVRDPGHRQRAQQRLRAAPDLDDLHPAQPVPRHARSRSALPARSRTTSTRIYVAGRRAARRCRSSNVAKFERAIAPLVVNHQGQFPAVTISLQSEDGRQRWTTRPRDVAAGGRANMHMPDIDPRRVRRRREGLRGSRRARSRC